MIKVVNFNYKLKENEVVINTTSKSSDWGVGLSPFYLGPVDLYNGYKSVNVENAWQFCKVYDCHLDNDGEIKSEYFEWAKSGWDKKRADRYPFGREEKPVFAYWNGKRLDRVESRKQIYIPLYGSAVLKTKAFEKLKELYKDCKVNNETLCLLSYDSHNLPDNGDYVYEKLWNNSHIKVGHAYVLSMLLNGVSHENFCSL